MHKKNVEHRARRQYQSMEAAVDVILANPTATREVQAALVGVSTTVFRKLIASDEFEPLRQQRMAQVIDPALRDQLESSLMKVAIKATGIVDDKMGVEPTLHDALATVKITTQALGMQNRKETGPVVQNNIQIRWLPAQE